MRDALVGRIPGTLETIERPVYMTFRKNRPPLVPDPGQQVDLLAENGETLHGFRAVSGPLSYERGGVVVWVATEA